MPESAFKPADDWAAFTGSDRRVMVSFFQSADSSHAPAVKGRGSKDGRTTATRGDQVVTMTTWHLVKDAALTSRPPLRSKITSCGEVWYVDAVDSDPDDKSWICSCVLGK